MPGDNGEGRPTLVYTSPAEIDIEGKKVWDGGPSPRPAVTFALYRDGHPYARCRG